VLFYLENPEKALEIGARARQKVFERYTFEDRADFLYELFSNILTNAQQAQ
jgi:spore maturation protein CgeB